MRPLILKFAETPPIKNADYSLIEYSNEKKLSVMKGTQIPAIHYVNLDTETFTKADGEPSDSDRDYTLKMKTLLDTSTETFDQGEPSDSDNTYESLKLLLDTQTLTESGEVTDSDQ